MKTFRKFIAALPLALGLSLAQASGGGYPLDHFPVEKLTDVAALQSGAKLFVNYCLNCHGASSMRYNRLQDIGLTEDQIRKNLLFSAEKVGEQMKVAITPDDAKEWFGALPPDLSVIARARASGSGSGADWLYTYLRSYYRDNTRATGWNNALLENVGMPHVFWELQGTRGESIEEITPRVRSGQSRRRQAVAEPVRRNGGRSGCLHHFHVRSVGARSYPAGRLGPAFPVDSDGAGLVAEPGILEGRQVSRVETSRSG